MAELDFNVKNRIIELLEDGYRPEMQVRVGISMADEHKTQPRHLDDTCNIVFRKDGCGEKISISFRMEHQEDVEKIMQKYGDSFKI